MNLVRRDRAGPVFQEAVNAGAGGGFADRGLEDPSLYWLGCRMD